MEKVTIKSTLSKVPPGQYSVKCIKTKKRGNHINYLYEILSGPFKGQIITQSFDLPKHK